MCYIDTLWSSINCFLSHVTPSQRERERGGVEEGVCTCMLTSYIALSFCFHLFMDSTMLMLRSFCVSEQSAHAPCSSTFWLLFLHKNLSVIWTGLSTLHCCLFSSQLFGPRIYYSHKVWGQRLRWYLDQSFPGFVMASLIYVYTKISMFCRLHSNFACLSHTMLTAKFQLMVLVNIYANNFVLVILVFTYTI